MTAASRQRFQALAVGIAAALTRSNQIGGSLAKLVYFSSEPGSKEVGGRLHFLKFETADRIDECIDLISKLQQKRRKQLNGENAKDFCVVATGGGAFKYYDDIKRKVGVEVLREDEMECLIIGMASSLSRTSTSAHYDDGMAQADEYIY